MARRGAVMLKSPREIDIMLTANQHVAEIIELMCEAVAPGVTTWDLDQIAREQLDKRGLRSPFLGYYDYPATVCTSVNEEIVHGIPRKDKVLKDGDVIGIDFGVIYEGYVGDAARTIPVGSIAPEHQQLIDVTKSCLDAAIEVCAEGNRLSDIGRAVQQLAEQNGYGVVEEFVGHGIGTRMHEEPQVPNFYKRPLPRLRAGLVIAIEPMLNIGGPGVKVLGDKWTAVTKDGSWSAHFEDSVAITANGPRVLSRLDGVGR